MPERDYGIIFPPRSNLDVDMYVDNEIVAGYRAGTPPEAAA